MKAKVLTRINALIALLLSVLGFNSCNWGMKYGPDPGLMAEYGCPYATFEATGSVTDENAQPVANIHVRVKNKRGNDFYRDTYTGENGEYAVYMGRGEFFPPDSVDVIVTDTADVYAPDSARVEVSYDRSEVSPTDHWNEGKGAIHQDFRLHKK